MGTEASVPLEPGLIWGEEAALVWGLLRGWWYFVVLPGMLVGRQGI